MPSRPPRPARPHRGVRLAFTLLALTSGASGVDAAPGNRWQELKPSTSPPPARRDAALVYDRDRNRVLLFGGRLGGVARDDTWELDLDTRAWRELATGPALRPEARFSMVAAIDSDGTAMIIATGQSRSSAFLNDAWRLDLVSETWSQVGTAGLPPQIRYGSAGEAFDPAGFDGVNPGLHLSHGFTDAGRYQDTWRLDPGAATWSEVVPLGNLPLRRCLHAAAMTSATQMILFGGCASGFGPCPLNDTWRLDLTTNRWTEITQPGPSARVFPALASLGDSGDLVLFGGGGELNDAWLLDGQSGAWTRLSPSGTPPAPRQGANLVAVDGRDRSRSGGRCGTLLLFGGNGGGQDRGDTWLLLPTASPAPPTLLAVRAASAVALSWDHAPIVTAYEMWRQTTPEFQRGQPSLARLPGPVTILGPRAQGRDDAPQPAVVNFYNIRVSTCAR